VVCRVPQLDNLMLKGQWPDVSLKMCDFGYSKDESKQSVSKSTCGTPEYMAPEVLFEVRLQHCTLLPCYAGVHGQPHTRGSPPTSTTCCAIPDCSPCSSHNAGTLYLLVNVCASL